MPNPVIHALKYDFYQCRKVAKSVRILNWYFSNNLMGFQQLADEGAGISIETTYDSIYVDIPEGLSAYQIQIKYDPGNVVIQNHNNENDLFLTNRSSENGVYTIMATPNSQKLVLPIEIIGRDADISISYKGLDDKGQLHGQMTKSMNIENIPDDFVLYPNYPNPFNPQTRIDFGLPEEGHVNLKIYDIMGREVVTLVNEVFTPGYKSIIWNATNHLGHPVSAGMYFYAIQIKDFRQIKKMILLK